MSCRASMTSMARSPRMPDGKAISQPGFALSSDAVQEASQSANEKAHSAETALTPFNPPATTEPLLHSDDNYGG